MIGAALLLAPRVLLRVGFAQCRTPSLVKQDCTNEPRQYNLQNEKVLDPGLSTEMSDRG